MSMAGLLATSATYAPFSGGSISITHLPHLLAVTDEDQISDEDQVHPCTLASSATQLHALVLWSCLLQW
jgi:hypothetical protein